MRPRDRLRPERRIGQARLDEGLDLLRAARARAAPRGRAARGRAPPARPRCPPTAAAAVLQRPPDAAEERAGERAVEPARGARADRLAARAEQRARHDDQQQVERVGVGDRERVRGVPARQLARAEHASRDRPARSGSSRAARSRRGTARDRAPRSRGRCAGSPTRRWSRGRRRPGRSGARRSAPGADRRPCSRTPIGKKIRSCASAHGSGRSRGGQLGGVEQDGHVTRPARSRAPWRSPPPARAAGRAWERARRAATPARSPSSARVARSGGRPRRGCAASASART